MADRSVIAGNDKFLALEQVLRVTMPDIMQTALDEAVQTNAPFFFLEGGVWIHRLTNQPMETWAVAWAKTHDFCKASYRPPTEEQLADEIIEEACLSPTPRSLARLYQSVGEVRYREILTQWQVDVRPSRDGSIKPGVRPDWQAKPEAKRAANHANNPWSAAGWNISRQGGCITAMGMEDAAKVARAVGCVIGSTRPNPKFN
jgi:hypothetical protein